LSRAKWRRGAFHYVSPISLGRKLSVDVGKLDGDAINERASIAPASPRYAMKVFYQTPFVKNGLSEYALRLRST
jgi:hypothetical protein